MLNLLGNGWDGYKGYLTGIAASGNLFKQGYLLAQPTMAKTTFSAEYFGSEDSYYFIVKNALALSYNELSFQI